MPSLPDKLKDPPSAPFFWGGNAWDWFTKSLQNIYLAVRAQQPPAQEDILKALATINTTLEHIMVDLSGVTQALADFKAEVATHATKIDAELAQLLAAQGSGDQAAVDAIAASISEETAALQAMDVSLDADDPAV